MAINQKIIGAFVVGFAMVAGAYTLSNFNAPRVDLQKEPMYGLAAASAPDRTYISVTDTDNNGIEDWREEFVNDTPLIIDSEVAGPVQYTPPTSITDTLGIQLFQNFLQAKGRGNVGPTTDQVVTDAAELLRTTAVQDYIYKADQILVVARDDNSIRTYANTLGQILINNNVSGAEDELVIIDRALRTENIDELNKLDPLISMYKNMRDQTLATPVPAGFEKQHLDLINVYQAVYATLDGMKLVFADPVVALLRVQRYQDDATGLAIALQNMYRSLQPYDSLFSDTDPGLVFIAFSPQ
jgi:hypothetical protein